MTSLKLLCAAAVGICLNVFAAMPACSAMLSTNVYWAWMNGATNINQNGTYGTQGVPAPANTPGARYTAESWTDAAGALWLFGGMGYAASEFAGFLNDLWRYDPAITNWTWMNGTDSVNNSGSINFLDPNVDKGKPLATIPLLGSRSKTISWMDNADRLWLFGGYGYTVSQLPGALNDLWKYGVFGGGISLDTNVLVFSATYHGTNPVAQMIGMTNVGVSAFTYTNVITYSTGGSGWLRVLPANGTLALSNATVLTNYVNISGLGAGTYYATNQVTAHHATNGPQIAVVTLIIAPGVRSTSADYDGDGRADPAVYEEATGTWKMRLSSANYYLLITTFNGFGGPGYASVSADYDGDRKADPAVYQEATGTWLIKLSSEGYAVVAIPTFLGGSGYTVLAGDFDGDRLSDPAVYEPAAANWSFKLSSAGYSKIDLFAFLGGSGYTPFAGDFDGDRLADPAIYGETTGYWIFKLSSIGYVEIVLTQTLGGTGYIPVPADYDGDGLADPAVRSETSNEWIVMFSSGNYVPVHLTIPFE